MKRLIFLVGIFAFISCSKQNAINEKLVEVNESDIQNLREAYTIGLYYINIAQVAENKAASNEIKQLAEKTAIAFKQINTDLINLATKRTISLPKDISDKQKSVIQKLLNEEGDLFDKKIVLEIKDSNGNALALYRQLYVKSKDDEISYWALNKLSSLSENLNNAKVLQEKLKIN